MFIYDTKSLAEILNVRASDYRDVLLRNIVFPVRATNCLRKTNLRTLEQLLNLSPVDICNIRGMGFVATTDLIDAVKKITVSKTVVYSVKKESSDGESLAERFKIDVRATDDVPIELLGFSTRLSNCLRGNGIHSLREMLQIPYSQIESLRGYGIGCKNELFAYLNSDALSKAISKNNRNNNNKQLPFKIFKQRELILKGSFDALDVSDFTEKECAILNQIVDAFNDLDPFLIEKSVNSPDEVNNFAIEALAWSERLRRVSQAKVEMNNIPSKRLHYPAKCFLDAFNKGYDESVLEQDLNEYITHSMNESDILEFVRFCSFNLEDETDYLNEKVLTKDRTIQVLQIRSQGKTLQEAGLLFDLTRERIRQIENKAIHASRYWVRQYGIIPKLIAEIGGGLTAYSERVEKAFGKYGDIVCYILKKLDDDIDTYFYDKSLDMFIFGDNNEDAPQKAYEFCESLPDQFSDEEYSNYILEAVEELSLPENLVKEVILDNYVVSLGTYRRKRLKLVNMYKIVLEKYYPNGLWVYGDAEIEEFCGHIREEFGDVKLGTNRAVLSGISRIAILCGRGVYRPKREQYISQALKEKIERYIDDNPRDVIIFNRLFSEFEDELNAEGIDNRYYLQGIIREIFGDKYFYRKDILSKTAEMGSASKEILRYVHESKTPVTMKEILAAFPGVTQIMVSTAMQDSSIIKFFWSYMYVGNVDIYDSDKKYFKERLDSIFLDGVPHHDSELFEIMDEERHDILSRLGILYPYNLFSVIEYLFSDYYNFSRPYIAGRTVEINHPIESLNDFVSNTEVFEINELLDIARQLHYAIPRLLDFFNGYNESHLFMNHDSMASIDYIGVNENVCHEIEEMFKGYPVEYTVSIASLGSAGTFPHINVTWNEWLIYSVIHKWGEFFDVGVVGNSFHSFIPIIAPKGLLDKTMVDPENQDVFTEIPDLENIDELLIDIIDDSDLEDF